MLRAFKNLHRARCRVFQDDIEALAAARNKINEEYRKNINLTNPDAIRELIKNSDEAAEELLTCVVQLRLVDDNKYREYFFLVEIIHKPSAIRNLGFLYRINDAT